MAAKFKFFPSVEDQDVLKRTGADIYVNYSTINLIRSSEGYPEDGLTKDFTGSIEELQTQMHIESYSNRGRVTFT